MTIETIIEEVVRTIQRYAKPQRMWLYGSRASGEATETSDIDTAFDDPEFSEMWRIEEEVATLPTLLKIDIKNIALLALKRSSYRAAFERLVAELEQRAYQERVNG